MGITGAAALCTRQITLVLTRISRAVGRVAIGRIALVPVVLLAATTGCLESGRSLQWQDDDAAPLTTSAFARDTLGEQQLVTMLRGVLRDMPEATDTLATGAPLPVIEMPPAPNLALGDLSAPLDSMRCDGSLRLESTPRGDVAVWWSARVKDRVHLLAAWRDANQPDSARMWRGPIYVDTLDQGSSDARDVSSGGAVGCNRPAPGLSVDAVNGYVHVSYALVGPEGPGIFYAHQMDPRASFEPPIPIVYGERLGTARVGSDGELVAVAYEDPNSGTRPRIALAVSRTAGHIFEGRVTVNAGLNPASNPFVVTQGRALVVGWMEAPPTGGDTTFLRRRAVTR